jgi:hypothetical protein
MIRDVMLQGGPQLRLVGEPMPESLPAQERAKLSSWVPEDSIAGAEAALAHAERKMANLRLLLQLPDRDPDARGPWAA